MSFPTMRRLFGVMSSPLCRIAMMSGTPFAQWEFAARAAGGDMPADLKGRIGLQINRLPFPIASS